MVSGSQNQPIGLPKLRFLEMVGCNQLEYIFPITVCPTQTVKEDKDQEYIVKDQLPVK